MAEGLAGLIAYSDSDDEGRHVSGGVSEEREDGSRVELQHQTDAQQAAASNLRQEAVHEDKHAQAGGVSAGGGDGDEALDPLGASKREVDAASDVELPPELRDPPAGVPDEALVAKIEHWTRIMESQGRSLSKEIRKSRGYQNPAFFQKMIEHYAIAQYGTCLPSHVWDPESVPSEDHIGPLKKQLTEKRARAQREQREGAAPQFVKGGFQTLGAPQAALAAAHARAAALASAISARTKKN